MLLTKPLLTKPPCYCPHARHLPGILLYMCPHTIYTPIYVSSYSICYYLCVLCPHALQTLQTTSSRASETFFFFNCVSCVADDELDARLRDMATKVIIYACELDAAQRLLYIYICFLIRALQRYGYTGAIFYFFVFTRASEVWLQRCLYMYASLTRDFFYRDFFFVVPPLFFFHARLRSMATKVPIYACMCVCMYICACIYVCMYIYTQYIYLSIYLSIYLYIYTTTTTT